MEQAGFDLSLNGRVALITGAGSGLGRATAKLLAAQGAAVGLLSRSEEELQAVSRDITQAGGKALVLKADVADYEQVGEAVSRLVAEYGRLDVVFANAGINGVWTSIDQLALAEWEETLRINLTGTFITIKHAERFMRERGGSIIVVSSVNGTRMFSNTGATAYACSKAAQVALTKMLALELASHKIRVNVICPGAIDTNIADSTQERGLEETRIPVEFPKGTVPLNGGYPGDSLQVAKLVGFLASDSASHITGTEIYIDGAQSLLQG